MSWDFLDELAGCTPHSALNLSKPPCAVECGRDDPWERHKERQLMYTSGGTWNEISWSNLFISCTNISLTVRFHIYDTQWLIDFFLWSVGCLICCFFSCFTDWLTMFDWFIDLTCVFCIYNVPVYWPLLKEWLTGGLAHWMTRSIDWLTNSSFFQILPRK